MNFCEYCHGFRHLFSRVENHNLVKGFCVINGGMLDSVEIVKLSNDAIAVYNNISINISSEDIKKRYASAPTPDKVYKGAELYKKDKSSESRFKRVFSPYPIIMLNDDFDNLYDDFIKNNNKQFNAILMKYGISDKSYNWLRYAFCCCGNSMNFFAWYIKNLLSNNMHFSVLTAIIEWNNNYSYLTKKLTKGTITAYNGVRDIITLINELNNIRRDKRSNDVITQFNTTQKKILKEKVEDKKTKMTLFAFSKLSDTKKTNFIRKMSTIEDIDDILHQMAQLCDIHFDWNRESFLSYLETCEAVNSKVVYDNNNVVIILVNDYETIKRVAKTTNWCISKNKIYWNNYIEHRDFKPKQYVLFDFNEKEDAEHSIVGFTVDDCKGITHAHSFTNNNMVNGDGVRFSLLHSYVPMNVSNIHNLLQKHNIPNSIFYNCKIPFKWEKSSVMNIIKKESIDIIEETEQKLVIVFQDMYLWSSFFPKTLLKQIRGIDISRKTMMFFDFTKSIDDNEKIIVATIDKNEDTDTEMCSAIMDSTLKNIPKSFESVLDEYNLPFNIIKRSSSNFSRFIAALKSNDVNRASKLLEYTDVIEHLLKKSDAITIRLKIEDSLFVHRSFDVITMFYNHGLTLSQILPSESDVAQIMYYFICEYGGHCRGGDIPTDDDCTHLINGEIKEMRQAIMVGSFVGFKLMLTHEPKQTIALLFTEHDYCLPCTENHFNYYVSLFTKYVDMTLPVTSNISTFIIMLRDHAPNILDKLLKNNHHRAYDNLTNQLKKPKRGRPIFLDSISIAH